MFYPSRLVPSDVDNLSDWQLLASSFHLLGPYDEEDAGGYQLKDGEIYYVGQHGTGSLEYNSDFKLIDPVESLALHCGILCASNWQESVRDILKRILDPLVYVSVSREISN